MDSMKQPGKVKRKRKPESKEVEREDRPDLNHDQFQFLDVNVDTIREAEEILSKERAGAVDKMGRKLMVLFLKIGCQDYRDELYNEFSDASEAVNDCILELHKVENDPYDKYLDSVIEDAKHKLEEAEKQLMYTQSKFQEHVFGNIGCKMLSSYLPSCQFLEKLLLSTNQIKSAGVEHLMPFISKSTTLRELDLSNNPLCESGAVFLTDAVKKNKTLEVIKLHGCELQGEGCAILVDALQTHPRLISLNLRFNNMDLFGAERVAELIVNNDKLEILDVSTNAFGLPGIEALTKALESNRSLTEVYFNYNGVNKELRKPENRVLLCSLRVQRIRGIWL